MKFFKSPTIKWWIVGVAFLIAGLLISYFLITLLHFPVPLGTLISLLFGAVLRFFAIERWVFKKAKGGVWRRFAKYQITHVLSYLVSWSIINTLVYLGIHYLIATLLATVITTLFTLLSHFHWVWRLHPHLPAPNDPPA